MKKSKHNLGMQKCDRCKKNYGGYHILLCDCPDCFWKFIMIKELYGKHLCKKCRKELDFPFTKKDFEELKKARETK